MSVVVKTIKPQPQLPEFEVTLRGEEAELLYIFFGSLTSRCLMDKGFTQSQATKLLNTYDCISTAFKTAGLKAVDFDTYCFCTVLENKHDIV